MTNETLAKLKNVVGQAEALTAQLLELHKAVADISNALCIHIEFNPLCVTVQTGSPTSTYQKLDPRVIRFLSSDLTEGNT